MASSASSSSSDVHRAPDALMSNMRNLHISPPPGQPPITPPAAFHPSGTSAPPPRIVPRAASQISNHLHPSSTLLQPPLIGPQQPNLPPNLVTGRPSAPLFSQPLPFGSTPPSSAQFVSSAASSAQFVSAPPSSAQFVSAPPSSGALPPVPRGLPSVPPISLPLPSVPPPAGSFPSRPLPAGQFPPSPTLSGTILPAPPSVRPIAQPPSTRPPVSNGPPVFTQGALPAGPRLPFSTSARSPFVTYPSRGSSFPAPNLPSFPGSPTGAVSGGAFSRPPQASPAVAEGTPSPYGWHMPRPGAQVGSNAAMQPPSIYGGPSHVQNQLVPPGSSALVHPPAAGPTIGGLTKVDPSQIPRPVPTSSVSVFETRQNDQACIPPPTTTDYVVKDTGNCSPRYMRCTISQVPLSADLLTASSMPLALMIQPLALSHPSEEPVQVIDFGESGPVRCSRCKGYINPFMKFIDQGRHFICNLCGFTDETPRDYYCNLGPDGKRRDVDERPELCRGTVEFVATKEYMVREPMPAVFFFVIDVSMNAVQTGATAAACSAVGQALADLPEGSRTMVGIATFDSTIHFYNLKRALQQPLMLIVPDVQDVYTPLESDVVVPFAECRPHLEQLLECIPTMFQNSRVAESAFGAAVKAAYLSLKSTGGRLLVFQSVLPSIGFGALASREAEGRANISAGEKETHKLLQPVDKNMKTLATELAEYQVCVDVFLTTQTYVDIASISVLPRTTGGQVYYYFPFSALSDSAKLYNDLRWNITRPQGFEAVMRVRCGQGLQVQEYFGNFCKRIPTDVDLPAIDCDKTIMVSFKYDDKFQEGSECAFQCALLYTTIYGQRRIRVHTLSLPCTSVQSNIFRAADLDAQFSYLLKQAANEVPSTPLVQIREQLVNLCVNILHSYRKYCATVSSSGQLILPESLKLLPLYTLALVKSTGLRTDGRVDDRLYWVSRVASLSLTLTIPLVYPRMIAVHKLLSKEVESSSVLSSTIPLSSEHLTEDGIYLLENGEDCLFFVGSAVSPELLQQLFGVSSIDDILPLFVLKQFSNELSKKLNDIMNEIRRQRCSYLRLRLCKKGDSSGMFYSLMVEDKAPGSLSYVEFLVHIHRQIQSKMA